MFILETSVSKGIITVHIAYRDYPTHLALARFLDFQNDDNAVKPGEAGCTGAWKRIMATDFAPDVNKMEYHYKGGTMRRRGRRREAAHFAEVYSK